MCNQEPTVQNSDAEFENFRLATWYMASIFLPGVLALFGTAVYVLVAAWISSENAVVREILMRISFVIPFYVWIVWGAIIMVWKRLYRFPPKAPEGTPYYRSARWGWFSYFFTYTVLTVVFVFQCAEAVIS